MNAKGRHVLCCGEVGKITAILCDGHGGNVETPGKKWSGCVYLGRRRLAEEERWQSIKMEKE